MPESNASASAARNTTDRELILTRGFDAPRERVFEAWTDPTHDAPCELVFKAWTERPVCKLDPRAGWRNSNSHARSGWRRVPNRNAFHEIVEPELLVLTIGVADQPGNIILEGVNTVTFTEQSGKTTLTLRTRVVNATAEAAPNLAGMEPGWNQTLERLAADVATESKEHSA
jgi:uncharacterized protein YndB with AHSA1/START domain